MRVEPISIEWIGHQGKAWTRGGAGWIHNINTVLKFLSGQPGAQVEDGRQ
jgi:hypothetical protein